MNAVSTASAPVAPVLHGTDHVHGAVQVHVLRRSRDPITSTATITGQIFEMRSSDYMQVAEVIVVCGQCVVGSVDAAVA
jgi:hypothetical protein